MWLSNCAVSTHRRWWKIRGLTNSQLLGNSRISKPLKPIKRGREYQPVDLNWTTDSRSYKQNPIKRRLVYGGKLAFHLIMRENCQKVQRKSLSLMPEDWALLELKIGSISEIAFSQPLCWQIYQKSKACAWATPCCNRGTLQPTSGGQRFAAAAAAAAHVYWLNIFIFRHHQPITTEEPSFA